MREESHLIKVFSSPELLIECIRVDLGLVNMDI